MQMVVFGCISARVWRQHTGQLNMIPRLWHISKCVIHIQTSEYMSLIPIPQTVRCVCMRVCFCEWVCIVRTISLYRKAGSGVWPIMWLMCSFAFSTSACDLPVLLTHTHMHTQWVKRQTYFPDFAFSDTDTATHARHWHSDTHLHTHDVSRDVGCNEK